jgi:hypothetical protein
VVFRVDGDVNGDQLDERETMMVTKWSRVSCSREAMRLESTAQHGQDGDDNERWFWAWISLPGDAEDRGDHSGEAGDLEVLW